MNKLYSDASYIVKLSTANHSNTLFNNELFLKHQQRVLGISSYIFELYSVQHSATIATIDFSHHPNEKYWFTPVIGAFSSLSALETISFYEMELLLSKAKEFLITENKASEIVWRLAPFYYNSRVNNKLFNVLLRQGWEIDAAELNFHLNITTYDNFRSKLSSSKRRELNRITKTNPCFTLADDEVQCREIYEVIRINRESQGYPMTMEWEAVKQLRTAIGNNIIFAAVSREKQILAGAICLRIDSRNLYVFYWGDHPDYRKETPVIKLAEQLYIFAINNGYECLDIGTSTLRSEPNQGLINFKENIGCEISQKFMMKYNCIV